MFKLYYRLTKPGIIYGNALPAIAGFFLASKGTLDFKLFGFTILGLSLVIASSCVLNNIYDAEMDAKMERTKNRGVASGLISKKSALLYALVLAILGFLSLSFFTNIYSLGAALLGFVTYVFLYTPLKSKTVYATLIGSVAGAVPPVVGYAAVYNGLDLTSYLLFFALVFWQMPHFYAIGIYRLKDYAAAGVPILPVKDGIRMAKFHILAYVVAFIFTALSFTYFKITGLTYLIIVAVVALLWLKKCFDGYKDLDNTLWARKCFKFSLIVLLVFCVFVSFETKLP